jgi:threonine dehydrogenase-like Zn-dependent dehydrogenase
LLDITNGDLPTLVFDATGSIPSMNAAFNYVANGGKLIFVGVVKGEVTFTDSEFHRREMTLLSSRNGIADDFAWVIDQIERGNIDTTPWVTHRAPFADMIDAFPSWLDPSNKVIKAVVEL